MRHSDSGLFSIQGSNHCLVTPALSQKFEGGCFNTECEDFCGISAGKNKSLNNKLLTMKEVTVQELKKLMDSKADFQLIDVREPHEYDICHLNGELIPMSDIPNNVDKIAKDKQVVIHCRSGKRSGDMLLWLEKNHGFTNLYNLKGGILAWAKEIDPEFPTY